jgi:hypothetical protein
MIDHDAWSYADIAQAFVDGNPVDGLTRDEVLDNITLTWLTNTGISSARLYWENKLGFFDIKGVTVPAAVSVYPREMYQAPRSASRPRCGPPSGHCVVSVQDLSSGDLSAVRLRQGEPTFSDLGCLR